MLLQITSPPGNTCGPEFTEQLLRTLHRALPRKAMVEFHIRSEGGNVYLSVEAPRELLPLIRDELLDAYPGLSVRVTQEARPSDKRSTVATQLRLTPDVLRLRTYNDFLTTERTLADPLAGMMSAVRTGRSGNLDCRTRLLIRPVSARRQRIARWIVERSERTRWPTEIRLRWMSAACSRLLILRLLGLLRFALIRAKGKPLRAEPDTKTQDSLFECWLVLEASFVAGALSAALRKLKTLTAVPGRFHGQHTRFRSGRTLNEAVRLWRRGFLLSPPEIATLWHPPTESVDGVDRVKRSEFRELAPPVWLPSKERGADVTTLGRVVFRGQKDVVGIRMDDLRRHLMVVGRTGCGKSVFLINVVRQQIESGRGVVLIDPHGQLADDVLKLVPKRRTNDVVVFDAGDRDHPIAFNPLQAAYSSPSLIADGIVTAFSNVFGFDSSTAPRLLHIFRNSLLTIIGRPDATLASIQRLLTDSNYRRSAVASIDNVTVREFWLSEFNRWNERDRISYIASLQNKMGAFLTNPQLQAILCSDSRSIDLRKIMDRSQVLVCNLSKGTVGHESSKLLGSLLLSSLHLAAMSRADIPEAERVDAVVVVDEFHTYLSEGNTTMSDAMSESRKYRTSYVLATQFLEQLDSATMAGVLGNCGSTLCMTVGPRDAGILSELLANDLTVNDLMQIPKYHGYLRLLVDGFVRTLSIKTLPAPRLNSSQADKIRRVSRQRSTVAVQ